MRNFLIFLALVLSACGSGEPKTPAGIIPKQPMIMLLTDVHLAEAALTMKSINGASVKDYAGPQYEYVFKLHHSNREQFIKSLKYYSSQPKELEEMYTEVLAEISKKQATGGK
jgi:hypothetical protein